MGGSMFMMVNIELAGVCLGLVASLGVSMGLTASTIRGKGTLAQKKRWLPELVTMEKVGAWAITEPDSGSDALGGMKTTVRRDGDDYILNGQKTFITNGPYADTIVVFAKLDDGSGTPMRDRKVLSFVLDKGGMPGLVQGKPFKKMGMMSSPTGELFFDNVRVGKDRLLGETEDTGEDSRGSEGAKAGFTAERVASQRCRWASSTRRSACRSITPRHASCGARRSPSSSSSSSSSPRWRSPGSTCRTCSSARSNAARRVSR